MKNYKNITDEEFDKKQKEFVWNYLREKSVINFDENIVSASKAFTINSVFRWAISEIQNQKMSKTQWTKTQRLVNQYIAGVVDLKWNDGKLISIEVVRDKRKK